MKLFTQSGSISKTMVVGWLTILSAVIVAGAEFAKNGDYSTYAILLFVNGVLLIVLRSLTTEPLK